MSLKVDNKHTGQKNQKLLVISPIKSCLITNSSRRRTDLSKPTQREAEVLLANLLEFV
jgi:hypothetical protein